MDEENEVSSMSDRGEASYGDISLEKNTGSDTEEEDKEGMRERVSKRKG